MPVRNISTKLAIEGENEYRQKLSQINSELKTLSSFLKLTKSNFAGQSNSIAALTAKGEALRSSFDKQSQKVRELDAALKNAQASQQAYTNRVDAAKAKIAAAEAEMKRLKSSTGDTTDAQKKLADELDKLQNELREASSYEAAATKGVNDWQKKLNDANVELNNLDREIQKNNKYMGEAEKATDGCATSIDEFGKETKETGKEVDALAGALAAAGLAGTVKEIAEVLIDCTKAAIEFESAITGVYKTVDGTDEQLSAISDGIREMSLRIPATTTELAKVAETAGQLGIATEDVLSFTEVMTNLGVATTMTAENAATMLAQLANITQMDSKYYSNLASAIVALGNNYATTEQKITDMAQGIAASASLAGMSEADMVALSAAVSSLGIEAQAGSTSMSKLISDLMTAVETGDGLNEFASIANMTAEEFAEAWGEDAVLALQAFVVGLSDTERNGKSAIVALTDLGITETRMQRMILSLSNSGDLLNRTLETSKTAWTENIALTAEAEKRYATTESKLTLLKNSANNLKVAIGNQLKPALDSLADAGSKAFEWATEFVEENPWIVSALTSLAVAFTVLATVIAGYAVFTTLIPKVTAVIKALNLALAANPALAVAIAIVTLVAAVAAFAATCPGAESEATRLRKSVKDLKEEAEDSAEAFEKTSEKLDEEADSAKYLISTLESLMAVEEKTTADKAAIQSAVSQLNSAVDGLNIAYDTQSDALYDVATGANVTTEAIKALAKAQADALRQQANSEQLVKLYTQLAEYEELQKEIQAAIDEAKKAAETDNSGTMIMGVVTDFSQSEVDLFSLQSSLSETEGLIYDTQAAIDALAGTINEESTPAIQGADDVVNDMSKSLADLATKLSEAQTAAYNSLTSQVGLWETLDNEATKSIEDIQAAIESQIQWFTDYNENLNALAGRAIEGVDTTALVKSLSDGTTESAAILAGLSEASDEEIAELVKSMEGAEEAKTALSETMAELQVDFQDEMDKIVESVAQMAKDLDQSEDAKASGENTIQGFIDGLDIKGADLNIKMQALAEEAIATWKNAWDENSPSKVMEASAVNSIEGSIVGVEKMQSQLNNAYESAALSAQEAFNSAMPSTMEINSAATSQQTVNHTGTIRVEGVSDSGEFIGAYDLIVNRMREEARR